MGYKMMGNIQPFLYRYFLKVFKDKMTVFLKPVGNNMIPDLGYVQGDPKYLIPFKTMIILPNSINLLKAIFQILI
jgi:hypothetical protein